MSKFHPSRQSRIPALFAPRLSEPEIIRIMLTPHLHLQMLLSTGEPNPVYFSSLLSVFNVATALAYMLKDKRSVRLYESMHDSMLEVAQQGITSEEMARRMKKMLCIADRYIESQTKHDVLRAIKLVESQLGFGDGPPAPASA